MPLPYDALKKLLGGSPDLNAGDPNGLVSQRLAQEGDAEEQLHRFENAASGPLAATGRSVSGATPSTFSHLAKVLGESPNFGIDAEKRVSDTNAANDAAMQAGFRGDTNIAGPASGGGDALGQHLYANLGDRSGDSPAQMAGQSASRMNSFKAQAPILAAHEKAMGDIGVEQAKGAEERRTNQDNWNRTEAYMRGGQAPPPATPPVNAATPAPGAPAPAPGGQPHAVSATSPSSSPAGPSGAQSWQDFIMGTGPRAYNGLMDSLNAMSERAKYGFMSTPLAPLIQNESFGNLEQLQAQFPGVRGFSYLLPKLKEHQSNFGKGESPDASYNRLHELTGIMDQIDQEMADPRSHAVPQPNGTLKFSQTPAAIQRAQTAVRDTKMRFQTAMDELKKQYPGLDAPISTQQLAAAPAPAGNSRFERIPE